MPANRVAPPFSRTWIQTGWVADRTTGYLPRGRRRGLGAGARRRGGRFGGGCVARLVRLVERTFVEPGSSPATRRTTATIAPNTSHLGMVRARIGRFEHFGGVIVGRAAHFDAQLVGDVGAVEPDHGGIALGKTDGVGRRGELVPFATSRCSRDGAAGCGSGPRYPRGSCPSPRAPLGGARRRTDRPFRPVPRPSALPSGRA